MKQWEWIIWSCWHN